MNVWKLTAAGRLEQITAEGLAPVEGKIKVRVTKVLVNSVDADLFSGAIKAKYPLVPGRFAIGIVAEEGAHLLFPKGTRVLLHSFCPQEDTGVQKRDFEEDEIEICGQTTDGFLSDFVYVSPNDMTPLPDAVNDESSLLLHHVALAQATHEALGAQKGCHVAVIGANLFGIVICRLLIYRQIVPILIDEDPARLEFARSCGVYYTLEAGGSLLDDVAQITGGRLVSGAVYVTSAKGNDPALCFRVCAHSANVVISGMNPGGLTLDLSDALRKQLSVHCVWHCTDYAETAINLAANHAVSVVPRRVNALSPGDLADFLRAYGEHPERDVSEFNIVSLV